MTSLSIRQKIETFFTRYPSVEYKKENILMQPDDDVLHIYYLRTGFVRMYSLMPDGKEFTINIFKPGSYFPLFLAFSGSKNTYFYEALTPIECNKIPKQEVIGFVKNNADVLFDFTTRISSGMHGLLHAMQYQLFGPVHKRLSATLFLLAKQFGIPSKEGIIIIIPLTHQDIANLIGIARETASLELEKLVDNHIISIIKKNIVIRNLSFLEKDAFIDGDITDKDATV